MTLTEKSKILYQRIICLIAGLLLVFSFSPFSLNLLAFISLATFFYILSESKAKHAFVYGYLFGLGLFGYGISWIYVSMTFLGDSPIWLSIILTIISILFISLFPALFAYLSVKIFSKSNARTLLVFPSFWVAFEMLRTCIFTGFPWLFVGYSQTGNVLSGYAKIGSVYLVSIVVCVISSLIIIFFKTDRHRYKALVIISLIVLFYGGYALLNQKFTQDTDKKVKVLLVQGDIKQQDKWNPDKTNEILDTYYKLTKNNIQNHMLIFWPENAIPLFPSQVEEYLNQVDQLAEDYQSSILLGIPIYNYKTREYYNGAMIVGYGYGRYLKHILVPFGEYFPLQWLTRPFVKMMNVPMSSFSEGAKHQPLLKMNKAIVTALICYESAFPTQVRENIRHSQLIAVISDDAWFGHTIGTAQHLEMTRMRAIETEHYAVQATNNGITAIINAKGSVIKQAPQYKRAVLSGEVELINGETPWVRYGMPPIFMLLILMLIIKLVYKHPFARLRKKD
jgi:apolipoprotein N-acyltransferase